MPFRAKTKRANHQGGIPLIRAAAVAPALALLRRIGAPVDRLVERAGLRPDDLHDPEAFVPLVFANRLMEWASRATGTPNLGLLATADVDPLTLGTYGRLVGRSTTVGAAIEATLQLKPAWNSGVRVWLTRSGSEMQLHHRFVVGTDTWDQAVAANLMLHVNLLHNATSGRWRPRRISLPVVPSPHYSEVPKLSDAEIHFGAPWTTISFPTSLLALPLAPASAAMPTTARPFQAPPGDLAPSVRELVTSLLGTGYPSAPLVADAAGMSVRTFQRRLADEGLTYAGIVADVRLSMGSRLLVESDRKIIDIALELGYSDPAHFTRAFTARTGVSPFEFRRTYRVRKSA